MHKIKKYQFGNIIPSMQLLNAPKAITPTMPTNLKAANVGGAAIPKLGGLKGLTSSFGASGLTSPITQTLTSVGGMVAPKTPSLTNSIGSVASSTISQINPMAGMANAASDLAVGAIFGKDKANPDDVGGQVVNQVANVASMFGPIGMAAGLGIKSLNALGTTKITGNSMDDRTGESSGFTGTISKNEGDKNLSIFGNKGKQRRKVAEQQGRLDKISGLLKKSDENFDAAKNFVQTNNSIDYTKGFRFGKQGTKLPNKNELKEIKRLLKVNSFKNGGSFNIIPDGKLHAHNHNLSEIDEKFKDVTNKGLPVISYDENGGIIQSAEIEKEEIIFTKEVTEELEKLKRDGSEEAMIKAGKLLAKEIMENTIDYTKKIIENETSED